MSKEVKIALIGATATILAAIIAGIFLLRSTVVNQSNSNSIVSTVSTPTEPPNTSSSNPVTITPSPAIVSTPLDTINTFCAALKSRDYVTQYNQFSSSAQGQVSEAQYAAQRAQTDNQIGGIINCVVDNINQNGQTATVSITEGNGGTGTGNFSLITENGVWKIDSFPAPSPRTEAGDHQANEAASR